MNKRLLSLILALFFAASMAPASFAQGKQELKLIVVCADFPDAPHKASYEDMMAELFSPQKESLHQYFNLTSSGKMSVTSGKYKGGSWQRMPKPITHYAKDTDNSFDIGVHEMLEELMQEAIKNGLDFDEYAQSWGGYPRVCVVVSGESEGYMNFPMDNGFWPHASASTVEFKGKAVEFGYILVVEGAEVYGGVAKVMSHEFGHMMGLADLYDYNCGGPFKGECGYPFTYFDIMVARHGGLGMSGFHRERLGYVEPVDIKESGEFTLPPITTNATGSYLRVPVPGTDEYFGLEYRKKTGVDAFWGGLPCEGLLVYRVDQTIDYHYRFNDGDRYGGRFAVQILNPGKTQWHEKACYSIESGNSVVSAKTDPSTLTYDKNFTATVRIEIISPMTDTITVKITIVPREIVIVSMERNWVTAGPLHKSSLSFKVFNRGKGKVVVNATPGLMEPSSFELGSMKGQTVASEFTFPKERLSEEIIEYSFPIDTENQRFTVKILLRNAAFLLDVNSNGKVEQEEIDSIYVASKPKDKKYDLDGNGVIDEGDLMTALKYVGLEYR